MRVVFHFDSGSYGGLYGPPITRLLFEAVIECVHSERRDVFIRRGDMPIWDLGQSVTNVSDLAGRIFDKPLSDVRATYAFIKAQSTSFPVQALCRILEVARAVFRLLRIAGFHSFTRHDTAVPLSP